MNTAFFLLFMVTGTFALGLTDVFNRKYLKEGVDDALLLGITWLLGALLLLPIILVLGVPPLQGGFWFAMAATVALNLVSQRMWMRAFQVSEASLVAPLRLLTPPLVILTGFFILGERTTISGALGILTTIAGLFVLLPSGGGFSLRRMARALFNEKGILLGILGAILFAFSFPFDKKAVLTSSALFASLCAFGAVGAGTLLIESFRRKDFMAEIGVLYRRWRGPILLISVCNILGGFLANQALNYALVAYAASAKRLWSLWTVVLAGHFLQEKDFLRRVLATLVMLGGIAITVIWG